jgi:hypothetical protein
MEQYVHKVGSKEINKTQYFQTAVTRKFVCEINVAI